MIEMIIYAKHQSHESQVCLTGLPVLDIYHIPSNGFNCQVPQSEQLWTPIIVSGSSMTLKRFVMRLYRSL